MSVSAQYEKSFRLKNLVAKYFNIEVLRIIRHVKLQHLAEISNDVIDCAEYLQLLRRDEVVDIHRNFGFGVSY